MIEGLRFGDVVGPVPVDRSSFPDDRLLVVVPMAKTRRPMYYIHDVLILTMPDPLLGRIMAVDVERIIDRAP
jgi:hypothetical protein